MGNGLADPHEPSRISIVVPCYNEAHRLKVESFRQFLAASDSVRILFVNDGSQDQTEQVLRDACCGYEDRTCILSKPLNEGKAEAVRTGINHALRRFRQDLIGYWDADLATPLGAICGFAMMLDTRPEIEMVFGSRVKLLGRHIERRAVRHYLGRIFATVVSVMLRLPIYDTQCGAKLFRVSEHMAAVFAQPFLSKWVFDVEIIARYLNVYENEAKRLEEAIYEYPLEQWTDIAGSKVRAKDFLTALVDILRIKYRYLRHRSRTV